jgi:Zn-dependent peptidase ImmA (M78 family)
MTELLENIVKDLKMKFNPLDREVISEYENIRLIEIELPNSINGVYYCQNNTNIIAIKKGLDETQKREVFWHEYYHYILSVGNFFLNSNSTLAISIKDENRADLFVALLLIDYIMKEDTIHTVMENWNVSENIARIRIDYEISRNKASPCLRRLCF